MKKLSCTRALLIAAACSLAAVSARAAEEKVIEINTIEELADYAGKSGNHVRLKPGVYRMSDFLSDERIAEVRKEAVGEGRPPVWMMRFTGSNNRFDLTGVTLEIQTELYPKLPKGYPRCVFVTGSSNTFTGLTIRNTGPNQGSGGNIFSLWGSGNTLENVTLHVFGSKPWGYGDLLGKGGPNITGLQKQSGIMVAGQNQTLRRCRVISRAFGHCFYVQNVPSLPQTTNVTLEDCYAEGVMRSTADMLRETDGVLANLGYRTIAENRDGRFFLVAGYMKSLVEDGFRTYGGTGKITLIHCTAINTRAGFEISGPNDGEEKTLITGGTALGCERGFLIGSNTTVRDSRGDVKYGPLLYLRGGKGSDIDLELTGSGSDYVVHALATLAGEDHTVRLYSQERDRTPPSLPIMLGYSMPSHAEMISPIKPAAARRIRLTSELPRMPVVQSEEAVDCTIETAGKVWAEEQAKTLRGWPTTQPTTQPAK